MESVEAKKKKKREKAELISIQAGKNAKKKKILKMEQDNAKHTKKEGSWECTEGHRTADD